MQVTGRDARRRHPANTHPRGAGAEEGIDKSLPSSHSGTEKTAQHKAPYNRGEQSYPFILVFRAM